MRRTGVTLAALTCICAGCGQLVAPAPRSHTTRRPAAAATPAQTGTPTTPQLDVSTLQAHPQAIEPTAGATAQPASPAHSAPAPPTPSPPEPTVVSVGPPEPTLPQPVPVSQIRHELQQSGISGQVGKATLGPNGLAIAPTNAPKIVKAMIDAGNTIAHLPYRYGGGHASFQDTAYDCSGSLSYVFAAAGLLKTPVDSSELMGMGDPGPGQWVTIYANPGHTFMMIAGLRFDTVALAETGSRWSNRSADEGDLSSFAVRHPQGL